MSAAVLSVASIVLTRPAASRSWCSVWRRACRPARVLVLSRSSVSALVLSVASIMLTSPAVERVARGADGRRRREGLGEQLPSVSALVLSVASIADQGGHVERVARGADAAPPA